MWRHINFRFGTILCSLFFERVPSLSLRETVRGHIASSPDSMHMGGVSSATGGREGY
jgi:hypothetical protein